MDSILSTEDMNMKQSEYQAHGHESEPCTRILDESLRLKHKSTCTSDEV